MLPSLASFPLCRGHDWRTRSSRRTSGCWTKATVIGVATALTGWLPVGDATTTTWSGAGALAARSTTSAGCRSMSRGCTRSGCNSAARRYAIGSSAPVITINRSVSRQGVPTPNAAFR